MIKIPSALKWLLDRRARLLGEIKKVNKRFDVREALLQNEQITLEKRLELVKNRLARVQNLRVHVPAQLQSKLKAIDEAIFQHNAMVDVDLVTPRTSQDNGWYLPHGAMSRYILRALREAKGQVLTTDEIAIFVAMEGGLKLIPDQYSPFKIAVRRRMRGMIRAGLIQRVSIGKNAIESRWAAIDADVAFRRRSNVGEFHTSTEEQLSPHFQ